MGPKITWKITVKINYWEKTECYLHISSIYINILGLNVKNPYIVWLFPMAPWRPICTSNCTPVCTWPCELPKTHYSHDYPKNQLCPNWSAKSAGKNESRRCSRSVQSSFSHLLSRLILRSKAGIMFSFLNIKEGLGKIIQILQNVLTCLLMPWRRAFWKSSYKYVINTILKVSF